MNHFTIVMEFLRDRQRFLKEVDQGIRIDIKIISLLIASSTFFGIYGGIIGSFSGPLQIISSAIKLPALYLLTLLICLPTLYFYQISSGSKRSFGQYLALLLAATSVISVMLFGFAPITFFFRLTINDYHFFMFLNIVIFAITGLIGVKVFYQCMGFITEQEAEEKKYPTRILKPWLVLYGFVGSQLGWTLRPFFGTPGEPFALFRELESNFYMQLLKLIGTMLGWG
ncbi:MAG: actin-binding WH2 domain-containing protein [Moorea sp. SIOASIH]|uniref:actin-binding WH2 domain-containing protein n=1 Tax=Moorena sp. SIOASIH TaxID=2607817 RepID=UPI0013B81366|nr:actin-binding WH2 domain-containing protein [Moorena sp. SIOASIH]NEO40077.1 actin-binding WH2 domain-containing protein [Moorena sp. SIOASIH]